jgi:hypothetical protein
MDITFFSFHISGASRSEHDAPPDLSIAVQQPAKIPLSQADVLS